MNIKDAETLSGISKRNIRYYEQEGMLNPKRNQENDYREYSEQDICTLKLIRALRMVDIPLDTIRNILADKETISNAAAEQEKLLKQRAKDIDTAIKFCQEFQNITKSDNIDILLNKMDSPQNKKNLFNDWINDYKKLSYSLHQKVFTFIPDDAVTTPQEFTLALFKYANDNKLNIIITKEGMYPEFTVDGIEYTAERFYTKVGFAPVATIRCTAKNPKQFEPDLPKWKQIILTIFHYSWILIIFILLNIDVIIRGGGLKLFSSWRGWLVFISIFVLIAISLFRFTLFTYNNKDK